MKYIWQTAQLHFAERGKSIAGRHISFHVRMYVCMFDCWAKRVALFFGETAKMKEQEAEKAIRRSTFKVNCLLNSE